MTKNEIFVRMENSKFYVDMLSAKLDQAKTAIERVQCFKEIMDELEKLEELEYQYRHYWRIKLKNFIAKLSR